MKKTYLSISLVCAVMFSAQETKQDTLTTDIEEVVISTQTLFPNKKTDERASSHIHIYTKELQKYNYSDVNRIIMGKSGVHVVEEDGVGLRPNINIRGTASSRSQKINLMEDGVLIAPAPYTAAAAYYFPNIGRMAGVEILKGSGQIQYGPNTVGGTFNMISTQVPKDLSMMLDASYGSFDTRRIHTYAGDRIGKFGYLVEYYTAASSGFKELPNGKDTGFDVKDAVVKLLYDNSKAAIPSKLQLKFQLSGENSDETYVGITRQDFNQNAFQRYLASELDNMKTNHRQYLASYEIKPTSKLQLNFDVYRNEFSRNWYKVNDVVIGTTTTGLTAALNKADDSPEILALKGLYTGENAIVLRHNNRDYVSQGVQFNGSYQLLEKGLLRFGARYHYDSEDRFQANDRYRSTQYGLSLVSLGRPGSQDNRVASTNATSVYVQYQQEVGAFTITPGVRFENIEMNRKNYGRNDSDRLGTALVTTENKTKVVIPGISVLYKPMEGLNVFAGAHKGFLPPGMKDGQKAETSWNYEAGVRYGNKDLDVEVIGYVNDYSNILGADTNAVGGTSAQGDLLNAGAAITKGIEAQAKYFINGKDSRINFPIGVSYTYFHSRYKTDYQSELYSVKIEKGFELPFTPKHQANVEVGANIGNFNLSGIWRYRGEFRMVPGVGEIPENQKVPEMNILDASASYAFNKNITLYTTAQNLLNKTYLASLNPAGLRPGMPRFVSIGVRVKL
ncbi:MAG: TonB-dependent receptor [Cruoricaptor ignavus]|nr:TonB-dependent receptor [Cruoricaptor ignavus]